MVWVGSTVGSPGLACATGTQAEGFPEGFPAVPPASPTMFHTGSGSCLLIKHHSLSLFPATTWPVGVGLSLRPYPTIRSSPESVPCALRPQPHHSWVPALSSRSHCNAMQPFWAFSYVSHGSHVLDCSTMWSALVLCHAVTRAHQFFGHAVARAHIICRPRSIPSSCHSHACCRPERDP